MGMNMKIPVLKIKPKKAIPNQPCALQMATMLNCWASKNDTTSYGACAEAVMALRKCMARAPASRKPQASTINYHLARLGKQN